MSLPTLILLAVALGTDAFSMCIGLGVAGVVLRQVVIISLTILIFHVVMPLAGWYLGEFFGGLVGNAAVIIGAVLIIILGVKMIWEARPTDANSAVIGGASHMASCKPCGQDLVPNCNLSGVGLLVLAACVSVDALGVGFSLGTKQVNLFAAAGVIGFVAGLMSFLGLYFGQVLRHIVGNRATLLGGVILVAIGLHLLFT